MRSELKPIFADVRTLAPDIVEITGMADFVEQLAALETDDVALSTLASRDMGVTVGVVGLVVSIVAFIHQINANRVRKGASRDEIVQDLTCRILENEDLSGAAKERLVARLVDKLWIGIS